MGIYKIIYMDRDGHPTDTSMYAKSKHSALKEARAKFDDVLKVKRVGSLRNRFLTVIAVLLALAGIFAALLLI